MCLTGRRIKAEEALAWGLADEMVAAGRAARRGASPWPARSPRTRRWRCSPTRATLRAGLAEAVKAQTDHELIEQTWLRDTSRLRRGRAVGERAAAGRFVGASERRSPLSTAKPRRDFGDTCR